MDAEKFELLEGIKQSVIEQVCAAAEISEAFAHGILWLAGRHLASRAAARIEKKVYKPAEGDLKSVWQLFMRAYKKWGISRPAVLRALEVRAPEEIKDLQAAWEKLLQAAEKEIFGGQND